MPERHTEVGVVDRGDPLLRDGGAADLGHVDDDPEGFVSGVVKASPHVAARRNRAPFSQCEAAAAGCSRCPRTAERAHFPGEPYERTGPRWRSRGREADRRTAPGTACAGHPSGTRCPGCAAPASGASGPRTGAHRPHQDPEHLHRLPVTLHPPGLQRRDYPQAQYLLFRRRQTVRTLDLNHPSNLQAADHFRFNTSGDPQRRGCGSPGATESGRTCCGLARRRRCGDTTAQFSVKFFTDILAHSSTLSGEKPGPVRGGSSSSGARTRLRISPDVTLARKSTAPQSNSSTTGSSS